LSYSVAALPLALFIPSFYSDELGLPLAAVGFAIAASRALDVLIDPVVGVLSDRVRTRFGRRKPWILLGAPLLLFAVWRLFVPGERGTVSITYLLLWTGALFVGFTLVDLPYKAWGAELSDAYDERSRVAAVREGFGFAGQIGLLLLLLILGRRGIRATDAQLHAIAVAIVWLTPLLLAVTLAGVREPPPRLSAERALGTWEGLALVARNPAFMRMIGSVLFFVSGVVIQGTLHRLVLTHVIGAPDLFPPMIFFENVATLLCVPLWLRVSDRVGKHRAVALAALWLAAFSLPLPFLGAGTGGWLVALIVIRGSSFASILFLANSMAADVVDADLVASGQQRTGLFFAVWGMMIKLAVALGVVMGTVGPAAFGFEPSAASQSAGARLALRAVYGWVPAALMAVGATFLWNFPITRQRQAALRAAIEAQRRPHSA
ncbi:MAG TPA: MFS transporter, partial [Myxococcota bacterium]|nr:MFS transporter [Myxococcota bacterium]